ncbi:hypothetical protein GTY51_10530, partial [Streptomyces sp. SID4936]|nr:hypothetical protein [Streptomyces sp. SID4936]
MLRAAAGAVTSKAGARRSRDLDPHLGDAQRMTAISLGIPSVPTKLADRRVSRK